MIPVDKNLNRKNCEQEPRKRSRGGRTKNHDDLSAKTVMDRCGSARRSRFLDCSDLACTGAVFLLVSRPARRFPIILNRFLSRESTVIIVNVFGGRFIWRHRRKLYRKSERLYGHVTQSCLVAVHPVKKVRSEIRNCIMAVKKVTGKIKNDFICRADPVRPFARSIDSGLPPRSPEKDKSCRIE